MAQILGQRLFFCGMIVYVNLYAVIIVVVERSKKVFIVTGFLNVFFFFAFGLEVVCATKGDR